MLRAASLAALSLLAALVVACGGGATSGEGDPASVVPADALVYADVTVRPEGDLREDAEAAAAKVLRTDDPGAKIRELVDKALSESADEEITYDRDIKPWLGERAGFWLSGRDLDGESPGFALVAAVTDSDAALDAIHKGKSSGRVTKRSYKGVDYEVDEDGVAIGIVDDFLAAGAEPEFKRTIDASKGDSLAEFDDYRKGLDKLEDGRLASFYMDLKRLIRVAMAEEPDGEEQLRQMQAIFPIDKFPPAVGAFMANGDRLAVDFLAKAEGTGGLGAFGQFGGGGNTPLMKELPGDSWAALGAAKYGQQLKALFEQYAGMFGGEAAKQQLKRQFGIDLEEDVLSWIGDVALFVRGDTLQTLEGGLVIQVTDKDKAAKGFGKLMGLLQAMGGVSAKPVRVPGAESAFAVEDASIPKPVIVARSSERVVVSYGAEAAKQALSPSSKLGDAEIYDRAKELLDDLEPGLLVSMDSVLKLVDSAGPADPESEFDQVRPYLEPYDVVAMGYEGNSSGGRVRVAAGLK